MKGRTVVNIFDLALGFAFMQRADGAAMGHLVGGHFAGDGLRSFAVRLIEGRAAGRAGTGAGWPRMQQGQTSAGQGGRSLPGCQAGMEKR